MSAESMMVKDADSSNGFNRSLIRAATKLKAKSGVEDGMGTAVSGEEYLFPYRLSSDA